MTTHYRVQGTYTWEEQRRVTCMSRINTLVEANSGNDAVKLAIKQIYGHADSETSETVKGDWEIGDTGNLTVVFVDSDDPDDPVTRNMLETYQRAEAQTNIAYMQLHSEPLFGELEIV